MNRAVSKYLLFIVTLFFSMYYFECFRQYLSTRNYSGPNQYFSQNTLFFFPSGEGIVCFALENWPA